MSKTELQQIQAREIVPGYHGRFVHGDTMTVAYWDIEAGNSLPEHAHKHEQVVNIIEGEFELIVEGVSYRLKAGDVFVLHSNVKHEGNAITDCRIIDVFQPVRKDYVFEQ